MKPEHKERRDRLIAYILKEVKLCEICGEKKGLDGHQVHKLSQKETLKQTAGNTLIVCRVCEDFKTYGTGIELNYDEAMGLIAARNREKGIDPEIG